MRFQPRIVQIGRLLSCAVFLAVVNVDSNRLTLRDTFDRYIHAIENRDAESLFTTVTSGDDFLFLTEDGRRLDREDYRHFHEEWFAQVDWEMPVGVPEEWPETPEKKGLYEVVVWERFDIKRSH